MEKEGLNYPMVLGGDGDGKGGLKVWMSREELNGCGGDGKVMVERLREKGFTGGAMKASI